VNASHHKENGMQRLREATMVDVPRIGALLAALGYPGTDGFLGARLDQLLAHPDARVLIAEDGDRVCGLLSLHFIPQLALAGDFCRISYFCIDADARGQGIGQTLEQAAAAIAAERGCDRIEVHCHALRTEAHRFYARQGYVESPKYLVKSLVER
jgi:GNAT superfamily N-acetyltransferase